MLKMIIGTDWKNQENEKKRVNHGLQKIFQKLFKRFSKINDVSFSNEKKEKISSEFF